MTNARIRAVKDTWSALPEVDALLAQLRHDPLGIRQAVHAMTLEELAGFRADLQQLGNTLYDIAADLARDGHDPLPLPHRIPPADFQ